jgi:hypothetical protein
MNILTRTKMAIGLISCVISGLTQAVPDNIEEQKNIQSVATQLHHTALASSLGFDLVESLTVEVGPRLAGSKMDLVAVSWAETKLKSLGFDRVYKEAVQVPVWERGEASARIISPFERALVVTALGGSIATPEQGLTAPLICFESLEALQQAEPDLVKDKIVFIDQKTQRHKAGDGYGQSVPGRNKGAIVAAQKGAIALLIRSIGTNKDRMAHTGLMRYQEGVTQIPAAAISAPDADLIVSMLKRKTEPVLTLQLSPIDRGVATSYNVIAEVTGSSKANEIVLIGAHLDSWDEGAGAIDDGAGVAIVTAAAKHILDLPARPARTIRVVLFAAEELGLLGGKTYAQIHADELSRHYIAAESDFGAGRIYRLDVNIHEPNLKALHAELAAINANGIELGDNQASGGPDVSLLPSLGVPVASLRQDGSDYFDYHHTPNDTLDKIDPAALAQNVATYAQFAYLMAQSSVELRPLKQP